jgi:cytoskeletal protein RodZ
MVTTLGQRLRSARQERQLSLEDAAHDTRIPVAKLRYLEKDNYAGFGNMTYARSFLKLYSRYLHVDASSILNDLPSARLGGRRDYRYLVEQFGPWVSKDNRPLAELPAWSYWDRRTKSPFATALGIFVALLIGTGIWGGHVASEWAQRSKQQEALAAEHDQPLGLEDDDPVLAKTTALVPTPGVRNREAVPLRAIPVDPAAVSTLLEGGATTPETFGETTDRTQP